MSVIDIQGLMPRTLTFVGMPARIRIGVETNMGLPCHCAPNVGTAVAKSRFHGFTDLGGEPLPI
eukprot:3928781-Karenia_brevis.AAC.1